jgi:hypothetical protein
MEGGEGQTKRPGEIWGHAAHHHGWPSERHHPLTRPGRSWQIGGRAHGRGSSFVSWPRRSPASHGKTPSLRGPGHRRLAEACYAAHPQSVCYLLQLDP